MSSLLVRYLTATQCDCNDLEGKTIKKAIREGDCYFLLFTDGQWCCTDYQPSVSEILEWSEPDDSPFVELGLVTEEDINKGLVSGINEEEWFYCADFLWKIARIDGYDWWCHVFNRKRGTKSLWVRMGITRQEAKSYRTGKPPELENFEFNLS